jgi:spore coat polysaccharide biosynthesis protein SpsF
MIAIITQARVNSTRLHNKIFLTANGKSFLQYHIDSLKSTGIKVIVATTNDGSEKPIVEFCKKNEVLVFKGEEDNVLKRFYDCAVKYKIDTIIRVTSDCPLIDKDVILQGIEEYKKSNSNQYLYVSNTINRTYARGMDFEIFSFEALKEAFCKVKETIDKEHVTPYIWKNKSNNITVKQVIDSEDNSDLRLTLDTKEDQILLTKLIEEYSAEDMSYNEIKLLLKNNESLRMINQHIEQKKV